MTALVAASLLFAASVSDRGDRFTDEEPITLDLGGRTLQIIHTPGHTQGSICILDVERRWLFSGDTICDEGVLLHFDHSCSVAVFKQSVEKLKARSSEWDKIWPCHHLKPIDNSFKTH